MCILPYPTTPPIDLLLKQLQWKLNKITNNHNKKEAWRSPSFASFSHLALCSLPDLVQVRRAPELLHFWSCNAVTAISEFLLLSSFIVLFWLFFLWMAWRSKWLLADAKPQLEDDRKCAVVAQVKGGHTKASLKSLVAILNVSSPFGFCCFRFLTLMSHTGYFRTLGRIWVFKNGNHYCWAERIVVWSSSEPPHKSNMVALHPGSVFLMEILALINDWVN